MKEDGALVAIGASAVGAIQAAAREAVVIDEGASKLRAIGIDPGPIIERARRRALVSGEPLPTAVAREIRDAVRQKHGQVVNRVCPQCAEGFDLNGFVVPQTPKHDRCLGKVIDRDAPGGGWDCECECRKGLDPGEPNKPTVRQQLWTPPIP